MSIKQDSFLNRASLNAIKKHNAYNLNRARSVDGDVHVVAMPGGSFWCHGEHLNLKNITLIEMLDALLENGETWWMYGV